jgi:amidophosphoribosyltransferase
MCGVFAAVMPAGLDAGPSAASVAALGLFALQHRGQESAGLAVSDGEQLMLHKELGLVSSVLDERRIPSFRGGLAIAHCRYSTTGSTIWENAQPTFRLGPRRAIAVGHNGNLVNTRELLAGLEGGRARLPASTDTELLTALLADEPAADTVDALLRVLPRVRGAYSLVVLDERRVVGVRDPYGFRPLVIGRLPLPDGAARSGEADARQAWVLSSETAGLDIVGAEYVREVEPGELVVLEPGREPRSVRFAPAHHALCVFELIYFARPDSYLEGRNLYEARRRMGMQLAKELPAEADLVMPVPDTGAPAAAGYAEAIGLPYREGMVRNRYSGRTFIQPSQAMRQRGVNVKLSPLPETVRDRRLIVVDDSIVRGTTTKQIVGLLRRAGAAEVHLRISAPPIHHPCFYGIDTQIETELIAARHDLEGIRDFVGADSLGYLSIKGVLTALDLPYERFCFACFDGNYPVPVPYDAHHRKFLLEEPDAIDGPVGPTEAEAADGPVGPARPGAAEVPFAPAGASAMHTVAPLGPEAGEA